MIIAGLLITAVVLILMYVAWLRPPVPAKISATLPSDPLEGLSEADRDFITANLVLSGAWPKIVAQEPTQRDLMKKRLAKQIESYGPQNNGSVIKTIVVKSKKCDRCYSSYPISASSNGRCPACAYVKRPIKKTNVPRF